MGPTLSQREVDETVQRNKQLMESADEQGRRLRSERKRSAKVLDRARKSLDRLARKNGAAA